MQATNFLQALQGAVERAGQEHQRRQMLEQGLNMLYTQLKQLQATPGIPEIFSGQIETLQQISPQLLAGAKTPQEVANVMAQIYGALQQTKKDITQYFEASKAIDELRRRYEQTQKSLTEIAGKVPTEYQPFFQAYGEQYKNVFETTLNLAQTLLRSGQTEQALQLTTQAQPLASDFINKLFDIIQFQKQLEVQKEEVGVKKKQVEVTEKLGERELDIKEKELKLQQDIFEWEKEFKENVQKLEEEKFKWSKIVTLIDATFKDIEQKLKKYEIDVRASVEKAWQKTQIQIANIRANAVKKTALIGLWRSILARQGGISVEQQAAFVAGMIDPNSIKIIDEKGKEQPGYFDPTKFAQSLAQGKVELEIVGDNVVGKIYDNTGKERKFTAKSRVPKTLLQKSYSYLMTMLKKPQNISEIISLDQFGDIENFLDYDFE
jgi:hypothetical protein